MDRVGAYEAKTHLPRLLERVAGGETIAITRHGVPVALLTPVQAPARMTVTEAVEALQQFRRGRRLGEHGIRELIEEGRRF